MTTRFLLLSAALLAWACFSNSVRPARADREPARSLDDQLLDSLGAGPLDEFDRELFAPDEEKPQRPDLDGRQPGISVQDGEDMERQLLRELGRAAEPKEENPLLAVARQMRQVERMIAQTESGPKTQDLQNRIVASLDELIKQARSCSKQCRPAERSLKVAARRPVPQPRRRPTTARGKQNPKPVTNPAAKPGQTAPQRPNIDEMKDLIKSVWGELPEAEREQMLEWMSEGEFLPKYELLIEQYFKRLSEPR